jgi:TorA maturation chaperone TorD
MRLMTVALTTGIIVSATYGGPALAQQTKVAQIGREDIVRSFQSALGRAPTDRELLRYRTLMIRNGWSEADVRADLGARTDYRKYRNDTGTRPTAAVRSAYQDILGRDPDPEGLRNYRQKMAQEGWSEQDVRNDLRRSVEYATLTGRTASADRIIRRAYMDVRHREPDPEGLAEYRKQIIENGWEYHDLRLVLARSEERRANRGANRGTMQGAVVSNHEAEEMVRRAYRQVLNREVDEVGLRDYTAKVLNEGWTEAQIARALRESDEYRASHR